MRPYTSKETSLDFEVDAVDFGRMFKKQKAHQLKLASAARMNATFPFILPNPVMPTDPPTFVMDGGALDNFGSETTFRFLNVFKDWINKNTSGVVIVQIRDSEKEDEPEAPRQKTFFSRVFDPIGSMYNNLESIQDYVMEQKLAYISDQLNGKIQMIYFEYIPEKKNEKAAMSLRLTARDKKDILNSLNRPNNARSFQRLIKALED